MPQRRWVAFMTVQTDESSSASRTCSVTGCCHAVLMADCSTLWARGRRSCTDSPTSVLLAGRHIQSMPTGVENVLELSPPVRRFLADVEVRRHGCMHRSHLPVLVPLGIDVDWFHSGRLDVSHRVNRCGLLSCWRKSGSAHAVCL